VESTPGVGTTVTMMLIYPKKSSISEKSVKENHES
jgi:hypothetical protein